MRIIDLKELRTGENKNAPADVLLKREKGIYDVLWTDINSSAGAWSGIIIETPENNVSNLVRFSLEDGLAFIETGLFGAVVGYNKSQEKKDEVYALYENLYPIEDYPDEDYLEDVEYLYETEDFE